MKILVACEESQTVTKAFRDNGHIAFSNDIQDCSGGYPEWHLKGDVFDFIDMGWDMMICHPPCTYLTVAANKWYNEERYGDKARERKALREEALAFCMRLFNSDIPRIAMENPVGYLNTKFRKADQIIYPYQFGDPESKRTCLWLKNLPKLEYTDVVEPKVYGYYKTGKHKGEPIYGNFYLKPSEDRSKVRSKTFPGIASAMANQWGIDTPKNT